MEPSADLGPARRGVTARGETERTLLRSIFGAVLERIALPAAFERQATVLEEIAERGQALAARGRATRLLAIGKAGASLSIECVRRAKLADFEGVAAIPYATEALPEGFELFRGGHPEPNAESLEAARRMLDLVRGAVPDDLVVILLSGGGSAAVEWPLDPGLQLDHLRVLNRCLVGSGADIVEINAVRKHLSAIKGGRLAKAAHPARQITLFVSDVPAGHDSAIASGPTIPDESTVAEAREVVERYRLRERLPAAVLRALDAPDLPETPKPGDAAFAHSSWHRLLANEDALLRAQEQARERGWHAVVDTAADELPVADAAEHLLERLRGLHAQAGGPVCVVAGGEVRCKVVGKGRGGRNQAFVLECATRIAGQRVAVLSGGTDGIDGNSDAAGAVADGATMERAAVLGLDAAAVAANSDSNAFFRALGDDLVTGPTGNNVRDVRLLLAW